ncbi:GGDEF domain-containing protein [Vibrio mangrovi]|uniref:diguanylate cyclase n=1 Tax=Vibrio mangrovi TaxID=474394 RepID=A0A1Y6IVX2_9VIBR|nr:GGDEF domain-containing protein [Vibrio mangrovi]MDW6005031.1 GGDEF domain-containing protein [Vibrio mangrovi]SMS01799.1 Response regulator PleD [Vibrio mangrovi]
MQDLLDKVKDAGLDVTSVSGEEAIAFWERVKNDIASTPWQKAQCYIISAEYRASLNQFQQSIEELKTALKLLQLPQDAERILSIEISLSERFIEIGDYQTALQEYISISNIAVEHGFIDEYAQAVLGMGSLCHRYGEAAKALRFYQKIDSIDHAMSSRALRLKYKVCMLACYIDLKNYKRAEALIKECEELSILVSDKTLAGQILLYKAKICLARNNVTDALQIIAAVPYTTRHNYLASLSCLIKIELSLCFMQIGKAHIAEMLLLSQNKKIASFTHPELKKDLYQALSNIYEYQHKYQQALDCQKRAFQVETDLMRRIPIGDLGATQLRRLSRFELQLKLILSEIENRELKETTENQKNTVAQLQQDVFTDPLTKLHNRRWLETKLKDLLLHETSFAFLVVDIDHFKSINDELSHLVGDKAIVNVSSKLSGYFNFKQASCVRFGGEEFLVILEDVTLEEAQMHGEHFREHIYQFNWQDILGERGLTVSIGITLHKEGENTQRTFYRADKALYRAKANGRNQVCTE